MNIITPPLYGTASVEDGAIYYEPDQDEVKNDEVIYELCNNDQECDQASVTIIREN